MSTRTAKPLLARKHPDKFVGRDAELDRLYLRAVSDMGSRSIHLSGRPGAGTSELLRQLYDRLFSEQRFLVPFYFSLNAIDRTGYAASVNYLYQFVLQAIAFRRQEPGLIAASPDIPVPTNALKTSSSEAGIWSVQSYSQLAATASTDEPR